VIAPVTDWLRGPDGSGSTAPADRYLCWGVAALSLGAGAIHFAVAPEHFAEYWLFGVFFVVTGWVQVALAGAVALVPPQRSRRRLFVVGLTVQTAVVVLWVLTRTWGLPVGPDQWTAEPVAAVDAACTGFEVAAAVGFALLASGVRTRPVPRGAAVTAVGAVAVVVFGLTVFAVSPRGLGSDRGNAPTSTAMAGMDMAAPAPPGARVATDGVSGQVGSSAPAAYGSATISIDGMAVPTLGGSGVLAGAAVPGCMMRSMSQPGHQVAACTDDPVTPAQRAAAESLVVRTRAALVNLPTLQSAYAAGYRDANITGSLYHLVNFRYLIDGKILDPDAVESLVYYKAPTGGSMLLGAMYVADPGTHPELIGGALTPWHIHTNLCVNPADGTAFNPTAGGGCAPGSAVEPTPPMLHVWSVAYPGGPFADLDPLPLRTAVRDAVEARGGFPTGG